MSTKDLFGVVEREVAGRGGGQAELYVYRARVRKYDARGGALDSIAFSDTLSLGVRVFRNGRMGFSYGFRDDEEEVRRMVEAALFCADASDADPAYGLPDDGSAYPDLLLYDPSWETRDDREKGEFASDLERRTLARDPRLKRVRSASLKETVGEVRIRNSNGRDAAQRLSHYFAYVEAVAEDGDEAQTGYGFGFGRRLDDLSPDGIAAEGAERALRMLGAGRLQTGRWPAVLENGAAAELLEVLIPSFLGVNVAKGKSMLAGKAGQAVAGAHVTVVDDPLTPDGIAASNFDDEGTSSRRNVLVEAGVLKGYLSDSFWGRKLGTGSTGSCRRQGPKAPPAVGISNLRFTPGTRTLPDLLREVGSGVLLAEFLGIHTADPVSGDFSVGAAGIRFEGGRPVEPVRGFAVSGNVLKLLDSVTEAGSDFRWFGGIGAPSLAITGIEVGGE